MDNEIVEKKLPELPQKKIEVPIPQIVEQLPTQAYRQFEQDGKTYEYMTDKEYKQEMLMMQRKMYEALMGRLP